jgi:6-phosphogluconolactonase
MKQIVSISPTPKALAEKYADDFMAWLPKKPAINIALSGGSTPKLLFQILAKAELDIAVWKCVHFFWGDERCVPPDHEDSNYRMTKTLLLDHVPILEPNIHRIMGERMPEEEAIRYQGEIEGHVPFRDGWPAFDLIMLGMGDDGHTASIFPDRMELLDSGDICAVAAHPASGQKRISLTGKVINNADQVVFLVTGANKSTVIASILRREGNWQSYPAAHIDPVGPLYWYLDEAAANGYMAPLD